MYKRKNFKYLSYLFYFKMNFLSMHLIYFNSKITKNKIQFYFCLLFQKFGVKYEKKVEYIEQTKIKTREKWDLFTIGLNEIRTKRNSDFFLILFNFLKYVKR